MRAKSMLILFSVFCFTMQPGIALAYLGPGAGLSSIGGFLALIAGIFVAIFGFVWYPLKRLLRKKKKTAQSDVNPDSSNNG